MKRSLFIVAPIALFMAAGAAQAQFGPNLLNNAGFENALAYDFSDLTNWNGFFGGPAGTVLTNFNDTGATPFTGAKALVTGIAPGGNSNGGEAFTGMIQRITGLTAGTSYELAVWARTNPNLNNGAEYRIEWQNAGGGEISRTNVTLQGILTSTYTRQSFTDACPTGATQAVIVLAVQSFVGTLPADTSVAWDDASFRTIPSPAAAALLGMGGLLVARRRR